MLRRKSLHDRVERRLSRIRRLLAHLVLTIVIALGIIYSVDHLGIPARTEDDIIPIVVLLFMAHALWVVYRESSRFIVQQEIQREPYDEMDEKPKRHLVIDDDGELTEVIYEEDDWDEKAKHSE